MEKFQEDAKKLLLYVGGKENIQAVSHCVARMRFVLVKPELADVAVIKSFPNAKGTFTQPDQFRVIIRNEVSEFYNAFMAYADVEGVSKDSLKSPAKSNQTVLQRMVGILGEIFVPLIPVLICGGLILGFRNIIGEIAISDGQTLVQTPQFQNGVYSFLWLIGEVIFHMLPAGIVWSITRKMGTTQILGIILGLTLVPPQLLNGFQVAGTEASTIPVWDFGFTQIQMIGYQGQVIAAMMVGFVLVYLEKSFRRHCLAVISMIVVPFCSLIPAVAIAYTLVEPVGWTIGNAIADIVYNGLASSSGVLSAAALRLIYAPIVMAGLHRMANTIDTTPTNMFDGIILWPMIALSNIAQGSSVLVMVVLQKKDEKAQQINIPVLISCYLGVTEPILFGVNLKYGSPLICGMIGSTVVAVISVGYGVQIFSIGVGGLPGIISMKLQFWLALLAAMVVAIIISFILTLFAGKKKLQQREAAVIVSAEEESLHSLMNGICMLMEEVGDQVFVSKAMGDGSVVELQDTRVLAPSDGTIMVTFLIGYVYSIKADNGKEVLTYIGMDTVELSGEGFHPHVRAGDIVKRGDVLVDVESDVIKRKGESLVSSVVFTDGIAITLEKQHEKIVAGDVHIVTYKQEGSMNLKEKTVYQTYPKFFQDSDGDGWSDLQGVISRFDYLQKLGIDYTWFSAMSVSSQWDNDYNVEDYRTADPRCGTMEDFIELCREAKKRGIDIMLDTVSNHASTRHVWFQKALKDEEKYKDYFFFRKGKADGSVPDNWSSKLSGPAWEYVKELDKYYLHLYDVTQANLNWDNPEVRGELADIVNFWRSKGAHGFRFDAVNLVSKGSSEDDPNLFDGRQFYTGGPHIHEYLEELNLNSFGKDEDSMTAGEMSSTTLESCTRYSGSDTHELTSVFTSHHLKVDYRNKKKWELMPSDFIELRQLLNDWQTGMQEADAWNVLFWCNHDQPRALSGFHDDKNYRIEVAKMLVTVFHCMRGTLYVYQSEEVGMTNVYFHDISQYRDVESTNFYGILKKEGCSKEEILHILQERSRDNARTSMQWNSKQNAGFIDGTLWLSVIDNYKTINIENAPQDENSVFYHYYELIHTWKGYKVIQDGLYTPLLQDHKAIFVYRRKGEEGELIVLSNFYVEAACVEIKESLAGYVPLLSNYKDSKVDKCITLRLYESAIYYKAN